MVRHRNNGIRKRCGCSPGNWSKCRHPWHFNFKWKGTHYRLSLDREAGRHLDGKGEAAAEAERLRTAIREGKYQAPASPETGDARPTFGMVAGMYLKKHVAVIPESGAPRRAGGRALMELHIRKLGEAEVPDGASGTLALAVKALDDMTVADIEMIRERWRLKKAAQRGGRIGVDRAIKRLRHFCNWAVEHGYAKRTPFKTGNGVTAVHFAKEQPRSRRLEGDEEARLLQQADPVLSDLIIAALETGCRKGELLALCWRDVKWSRNVMLLPADVTKTAEDRDVPMTQRLRGVLEMRRHAPNGAEHPPGAHVFGNEVGERIAGVRERWERTCRAANITGLAFHDLRREAASRLRESGAPDHVVAAWLGHANISTTSRYLRTSRAGLQRYLVRFEQHRAEVCTTVAQTGSNHPPTSTPDGAENPANLLN